MLCPSNVEAYNKNYQTMVIRLLKKAASGSKKNTFKNTKIVKTDT